MLSVGSQGPVREFPKELGYLRPGHCAPTGLSLGSLRSGHRVQNGLEWVYKDWMWK